MSILSLGIIGGKQIIEGIQYLMVEPLKCVWTQVNLKMDVCATVVNFTGSGGCEQDFLLVDSKPPVVTPHIVPV